MTNGAARPNGITVSGGLWRRIYYRTQTNPGRDEFGIPCDRRRSSVRGAIQVRGGSVCLAASVPAASGAGTRPGARTPGSFAAVDDCCPLSNRPTARASTRHALRLETVNCVRNAVTAARFREGFAGFPRCCASTSKCPMPGSPRFASTAGPRPPTPSSAWPPRPSCRRIHFTDAPGSAR